MGADLIAQLERWLVELARRWERYLARDPHVPLPPDRERAALERRLRELSREEAWSASDRFRLDQLLHRFSSYSQLWQRQLSSREVGPSAAMHARPVLNAPATLSVPPVKDELASLHTRYAELIGRRGGQAMAADRFRALLDSQKAQLEGKGNVVEGFDVVEVDGQIRVQARVRRGRKQ